MRSSHESLPANKSADPFKRLHYMHALTHIWSNFDHKGQLSLGLFCPYLDMHPYYVCPVFTLCKQRHWVHLHIISALTSCALPLQTHVCTVDTSVLLPEPTCRSLLRMRPMAGKEPSPCWCLMSQDLAA